MERCGTRGHNRRDRSRLRDRAALSPSGLGEHGDKRQARRRARAGVRMRRDIGTPFRRECRRRRSAMSAAATRIAERCTGARFVITGGSQFHSVFTPRNCGSFRRSAGGRGSRHARQAGRPPPPTTGALTAQRCPFAKLTLPRRNQRFPRRGRHSRIRETFISTNCQDQLQCLRQVGVCAIAAATVRLSGLHEDREFALLFG